MNRENDPRDPSAGAPPGSHGCVRPVLERLRFWNGRFLVARDLRHQQADLMRRLEYHQHFAHGEGILCGFGIRPHPREECRRDWLVVDPGMAYDCCGRTLWMAEPRAVLVPGGGPAGSPPADAGEAPEGAEPAAAPPGEADAGEAQGNGPDGEWPGEGEPERRPDPRWFVVARRVERPTDPQPALYADDLCEPVRHEHGRVREEVELHVVPAREVPHECWPRWRPVTREDCERDFVDDCRLGPGDTLPCDRGCACGDHLVLAAVHRDRSDVLRWDLTHRRVLAPPAGLTRITGISWPHGGDLGLDQLRKQGGRLVVRFSRRLRESHGPGRGVNYMTFSVSYADQKGIWEQILFDEGDRGRDPPPHLSPNGRCAVFTIPDRLLGGRHDLGGSWVRVRLLCDFILDCHGRAVSAAHLGGDANGRGSGNGVPGGTFESWFFVSDPRKED